ncbi:hypothetical protein ACJX0J_006565, partial [Zea mays]
RDAMMQRNMILVLVNTKILEKNLTEVFIGIIKDFVVAFIGNKKVNYLETEAVHVLKIKWGQDAANAKAQVLDNKAVHLSMYPLATGVSKINCGIAFKLAYNCATTLPKKYPCFFIYNYANTPQVNRSSLKIQKVAIQSKFQRIGILCVACESL